MQILSLYLRRFLSSPVAIAVCVCLGFMLALGSVPLFDLDEGAFTEATREMLESGIFSATYLDGEPRYDKPIFFYWLQAISITLFGFNEWAFRLPSVLMACLWAFAVYRFGREFIGKQRGLIASLFLVNMLWVALIARSAIADATLNLFLSLALFDIWRYYRHQSKPVLIRVYLWMALATLTKGPIGVAIPLLVSVLFFISSRVDKKFYAAYFNPLGWLVYIAAVAPWLIAVYLEQGLGFFEGFIVEHNLKRFSSTRESHGGSLFYYVVTLPIIVLPFTGLLGDVFKPIRKHWNDPLNRFLLIWFGIYFLLFSFSKTQLPHYVLNGCVPLIIMFARQTNVFNKHQWFTLFPLAFMALLVALPLMIPSIAQASKGYDGAALSRYADVFTTTYTVSSLIAFCIMCLFAFLPRLRTWQRLVLAGLTLNVFVFSAFAPIASGIQQTPVHEAIAFLEARNNTMEQEQTIVAYRMHMPSFSVYRGKITPLRAPQPGELVLTRVDRLNSLTHHLHKDYQSIQLIPLWTMGGLTILEFSAGQPL